MLTQVKTPHDVFFIPQRLLVPLFQRPYVWNQERQWQPLWDDVKRVAQRLEREHSSAPHFLGAVVLQQQPNEVGTMAVRTVIDGQQRLTTLQLLMDAIHAQVHLHGEEAWARQALDLVENPEHFRSASEDAFKVWPTNRDRSAFNEVMQADVPVNYGALKHKESKLAKAHQYFFQQAGEWISEGNSAERSKALVKAVSQYLQLVVIDLQADEDAQEIFETLNARGTPLTAADLIKNFVFQRLEVSAEEAEKAYHEYWEIFETPFWETEVQSGRILYSRSSLFLTQWLVAQTQEDITAREVFGTFKRFVTDGPLTVNQLLPKLRRDAEIYQRFTEGAMVSDGSLSRLNLFVYRMSTMDSEVIKPLLIWLLDSDKAAINDSQLQKALDSLESWFVRRAICRAQTKRYNQIIVDLLTLLEKIDRQSVGDAIEDFLANQTSESSYWPTDADVWRDLANEPIYRKLGRSRLRMIIEALEDKRRGYISTVGGKFSGAPVSRGIFSIEHVIPQEWQAHWPAPEYDDLGMSRDILVHTLGNLTLLTKNLNSKVSNVPWDSKRELFKEHATLLLTSDIVHSDAAPWGAHHVHERTSSLIDDVLTIWPVPPHNQGLKIQSEKNDEFKVTVADLVSAGMLQPGQTIYARTQAHFGEQATVSEDGGIYVSGQKYDTPSGAGKALTGGGAIAGWWFWVTDLETMNCIGDLRTAYVDSLNMDAIDDEGSAGE